MIEFIDAISIRLNEIFDGKYPIHLESVEQGLVTPCFFIQPMLAMDENMISNRKQRIYRFDIIFIPEMDSAYRSLFAEVSEKLFEHFDSVEINGGVYPTFDRSINVVNDVLHFKVRFKFYARTELPEEDKLETMNISVM